MTVGQRVLSHDAQEMWDSVVVSCAEEHGALRVRVTSVSSWLGRGPGNLVRPVASERPKHSDVDLRPRAKGGERRMSGHNSSPGRAAFGFLWKNCPDDAFVKEFSLD